MVAGLDSWVSEAIAVAARSPHRRYQTGAILIGRDGAVITNGWAHPPQGTFARYWSMHAELHALHRAGHHDLRGAGCALASIARRSGRPASARPCWECARLLRDAGVRYVAYTTKAGVEQLDLNRAEHRLRLYQRPSGGVDIPAAATHPSNPRLPDHASRRRGKPA
ncbi:hypothetical protein AYO39_01455 [Actinobacteria bacterium SCGC AG-212-D09]|nr:hypothetical protein AYO39_01455 [Actinobacteria bacterium SCGC AG-212-D09]